MHGPQADQAHLPDALRRRPLDSPNGGQAVPNDDPRPPEVMPGRVRRPSRRVTAAEMKAIQAQYDPNAIKKERRPAGWPVCCCGNHDCPDKGVGDAAV